MSKDEPGGLPADETIALLVRAARRAGIDVESDALLEAPAPVAAGPSEWRRVQASVVALLAIVAIVLGYAAGADNAALVATIVVLGVLGLVVVYTRTTPH